ncbi:MAG: hypothetical protein JF600_14975 [Xanthomonadales bacterium]|nr:hypothetical protein [Xanthomonadales bacterium]
MTPSPDRGRGRRTLLLLLGVFAGPIALAWILNAGGLIPGAKTVGERLEPIVDLRDAPPRLADGSRYDWAPAQRMRRLLVVAPAACDAACATLPQELEKLRLIFGGDAEHLEILWMGPYPAAAPPPPPAVRLLADDPALRARLPRAADPTGAPVYVVDPYGFVILRYRPGTDISEMRKDLSKLLKMQ